MDVATTLSLDNPVFHTYVIVAAIMILKLMIQPWMTVWRMMRVHAGFRSPEDLKKSPLNPVPVEGQTDINEFVDRSRRINLNDLESIPAFHRLRDGAVARYSRNALDLQLPRGHRHGCLRVVAGALNV
jgi:hypothetical protein